MIKFNAIVAALVLGTATVATAQEAPTANVSYADLNLGTAAGRQMLDQRISIAVKRVCGTGQSLQEDIEVRKCRTSASAAAHDSANLAMIGGSQTASASR